GASPARALPGRSERPPDRRAGKAGAARTAPGAAGRSQAGLGSHPSRVLGWISARVAKLAIRGTLKKCRSFGAMWVRVPPRARPGPPRTAAVGSASELAGSHILLR